MSVCPSAWNNSAPIGRILMKFDMSIFRKYVKKFNIHLYLTRKAGNVQKHARYVPYVFISSRVFLGMRNVSNKSCREQIHFILNIFLILFFRTSSRLCDNVEKYGSARQDKDDNICVIRRIHFACWPPEATDTHSEGEFLLLLRGNNGLANAPVSFITWPTLWKTWTLLVWLSGLW
jgi:hypothetical protein